MGKTYLQGDTLTAADLNASLAEAVNTTGTFTFTGVHVHNANLWANGADGGFRVLNASAVQSFRTDQSTSFYTLINGMDDTGVYYSSTATYAANRSFRWIQVDNRDIARVRLTIDRAGNLNSANTISDQIGNLRSVPINSSATGYTLVALDAGKTVSIAGGTVTIPANVFSAGDNVTIYNSSTTAVNLTIARGTGLTMYWSGQSALTNANRTLALQGLCTILFTSATTAIITGAGLT